MDPQLVIDDGGAVTCRRHLACSHHVVGRGAAFARDIQKLVIRLAALDPGIDLVVEIPRHRRGVHHLSGQPDCRHDKLPVELVVEIVRIDLGLVERIACLQPDPSARLGSLLPCRDGEARLFVEL